MTTPAANVGYVRVSTVDQNTSRQLADLNVKLDKIFTDRASGKNTGERPELQRMLHDYIREGDHLYVHSMDRLARNIEDLLRLVKELNNKGVIVHFVKENLTFDPSGKENSVGQLMLTILGGVAQFERALILERQREGIAQAKARGAYKGRKPVSEAKIEEARKMIAEGKSLLQTAKELRLSRTTLYKYLRPAKAIPAI